MKEINYFNVFKKFFVFFLLSFVLICSACNESTNEPTEPTQSDNQTQINPTVPDEKTPNTPTPPKTDNVSDEFEGYYEILDGLYVNHLPGVYKEDISLEFKFEDKKSRLFYSLDYSTPNTMFLKNIKVNFSTDKFINNYPLTSSVDAILAHDTLGKCVSNMYINNVQNPQKYSLSDKQFVLTIRYVDFEGNESTRTLTYLNADFDIPVISLSMPYDNWFGEENGFYNKIREEISHRVHMEYFDSEYDEYFYVNSKIKLGGNWSLGYPQRTLNLNFNKDENGNKNEKVKAHIFGERMTLGDLSQPLTDLTRFRLHNGGNCFEERTGFSDAILQNLMYGTNVSTTAYRPCVAYLNGEFWGLYSIREHYSDTYFEDNYGVDKDNVALYELKGSIIFDDGNDTGSDEFFADLKKFLKNDFSKDNIYYTFIDNYVDVDSLIDCFIAHSYAGNWDFVGNYNNLKMWRTVEEDPSNPYADGKLRFCLHDVDFAFMDNANFLSPQHANSYMKFDIFAKLMENVNFKIRFYERAAELIETNLSYENVEEVVYSMVDDVMYYRLAAFKRWGNTTSYSTWRGENEKVLQFVKDRNKNYLSMVKNTFGLKY